MKLLPTGNNKIERFIYYLYYPVYYEGMTIMQPKGVMQAALLAACALSQSPLHAQELEQRLQNTPPCVSNSVPPDKALPPFLNIQRKSHSPLPLDYSMLMTDAEFTDFTFLNASEIQSYLKSINSCLNTPVDGKYFAGEVVRLARKHQINPLLLLARAQVEKSVVKKQHATQKQLDEIMGYGIPDSGSRANAPSGFLLQLENAARRLRELYEEGLTLKSNLPAIKVNYGKASVSPRNAATYALLRYTPHTVDTRLKAHGGGNFLFRQVYDAFKEETYAHMEAYDPNDFSPVMPEMIMKG